MTKTLTFKIKQYVDGTYKIETANMHYHYQDGLLVDKIRPEELGKKMREITEIVNNKYDLACLFEID